MADDKQTGSDISVDEETKRQAEEQVAGLDERYEPGARPTVVLPGTDGMVSGTAFADIVEDNTGTSDEPKVDAGTDE
ncbi:hypothetical protein HQ346_22845 [Rhodococcus sp. BP-252]|uniref:hypothetical protein n=1 Tax=unclassified Rhodococcus (in: high G+C Gram-positive bacteria) TaxID=192944 RepID=UPI000DF25A23|nr:MULTISPECIES: hypothetical protein [unclassified Rhodococcus (in: high G+C Gram-positive bacteria)]MBY6414493.1 hypothetical protein [Rhodococcus sp. BP-320]MBY6419197.1 hypothetical protein [Rhodococcus sp. BP-321]MBY6423960.1 hypothetical protein [Rhodococcus sp. BP-324]MBY6429342.1 hypothetical protein [Rhodococcus sp. BP-323]MBY6434303.1 hypothetical protein [Rhodococcus sp. BP-322]